MQVLTLLLPLLDAASGSICATSSPTASSLAPACISSSLLHLSNSQRVEVGGEGGPATCLAACLAVHSEDQGGVAVRWEGQGQGKGLGQGQGQGEGQGQLGLTCGCLDLLPAAITLGPQVHTNSTGSDPGFFI